MKKNSTQAISEVIDVVGEKRLTIAGLIKRINVPERYVYTLIGRGMPKLKWRGRNTFSLEEIRPWLKTPAARI